MKTTEKQREQMRIYYLKNRDRIKQRQHDYRWGNIALDRERKRIYREKFKEKANIASVRWINARKRKVYEMLGEKCSRCGFGDVRAMQIHHKAPKTKKRDDYLRLRFDLSKVELVCANCHSIEHAEFRKNLHKKYSY